MGHPLAIAPNQVLERWQRDPRLSEVAKRAAKKELDRRSRLDDACSRGAGCAVFDCERTH